MKTIQAIQILKQHNKWRKWDETIPETNPWELWEAIDTIVEYFDKR